MLSRVFPIKCILTRSIPHELVSVMAYLPSTDCRGVEHPHDTPLIPSSGHQLLPIGPNQPEEYDGYRFYHIKRMRTSFCICCSSSLLKNLKSSVFVLRFSSSYKRSVKFGSGW